jgi:U6 snRNA-associated Sm-like protein LSm1
MANYLPGTASLVEEVDKKLLVVLRDGRTLIGYLRSIDQFANLVLHRTIERIHVGKKYGDIPRGIFVVRGENVVLLGEIDLENEGKQPLEQVAIDDILEMQREEQLQRQEEEERKKKALMERGLSIQTDPIQEDFF